MRLFGFECLCCACEWFWTWHGVCWSLCAPSTSGYLHTHTMSGLRTFIGGQARTHFGCPSVSEHDLLECHICEHHHHRYRVGVASLACIYICLLVCVLVLAKHIWHLHLRYAFPCYHFGPLHSPNLMPLRCLTPLSLQPTPFTLTHAPAISKTSPSLRPIYLVS
jgi:hypothetical protein